MQPTRRLTLKSNSVQKAACELARYLQSLKLENDVANVGEQREGADCSLR